MKYALLKCMLILTNNRDHGAVIIDGWRSAMKAKHTMEEYNGSGGVQGKSAVEAKACNGNEVLINLK